MFFRERQAIQAPLPKRKRNSEPIVFVDQRFRIQAKLQLRKHALVCERHTIQAPLRKCEINTQTCFLYERFRIQTKIFVTQENYRNQCVVVQSHTSQTTPTQHKTLPHGCFS